MEGVEVSQPDLSIVIPCYNEEDCLPDTIPPLAAAFDRAGVATEIILVDNGSTDATSEVIDDLIARGLPVKKAAVEVNIGQGQGFLTGFEKVTGRYAANFCADGQVEAEDVVKVYLAAATAGRPTLAKARRRYRNDDWVRKVISIGFNGMMQVLFIGLPSIDVNGNPKVLPADILRQMELGSTDWFIEAEIMLKAYYLKMPTIEFDVFGLAREGGQSHVRFDAIIEFLKNVFRYRFGGPWRAWKARNRDRGYGPESAPTGV
ncbi:MAG: glycosyltransferase family 2 protein [Gemmatimonadota bacterium]|nr:glycosyltransferase family 2 protein [Gemmatimonadota bacterium]